MAIKHHIEETKVMFSIYDLSCAVCFMRRCNVYFELWYFKLLNYNMYCMRLIISIFIIFSMISNTSYNITSWLVTKVPFQTGHISRHSIYFELSIFSGLDYYVLCLYNCFGDLI